MTSVLAPTYALDLGSQRFTTQAVEISVSLALAPVVDALTVTFPSSLSFSAAPGDKATLTLGNGEKDAPVFTGTIEAVHRSFDVTRVRALNAGGALARFRPAATYEQTSAGDVVRSLCGEAGVSTADVEDGVELAYYVADPARNAYEHIARVAEWSGAVGRVTADDELETLVIDATAADVALKYGRELLSIDHAARAEAIERFVVAGASGAGSASVPEALKPSTDFFGGNRPAPPSPKARWYSEPALRTAKAAATAGASRQRSYGASRSRGSLVAFLQPELRPGSVIEIQELPDGFPADKLWLRRVRHIIGPRGATTRADFDRGGDAFDPLALLGSLAGAIAGAF
ncbi:MAG TPA: hypothetical protein VJ276_21455 [Thermoanaerobaculia bacterium]|nr:hypothetical protein [Thermoanaerobaculia bacterium]